MAATREPYRSSSPQDISGNDFLDQVADNATAFWKGISLPIVGVNGTNDVTGTITPPVATYSDGMVFQIEPVNTNTGAVTFNGRQVTHADGSAMEAGEFQAGTLYTLRSWGGGFRIVDGGGSASGGGIYERVVFTSAGTWNKPDGIDPSRLVKVQMWAGGGSGYNGSVGGGGGGGGYIESEFLASELPSSVAVTVGSGGVAGIGGGGGQDSSFGALLVVYGGEGGSEGGRGSGGGPINGDNSSGLWSGGDGGTASTSAPSGVSAVFGGGGGGGRGGSGGASIFGGSGGSVGQEGQIPGGGGGRNASGSSAGGRGEVRVTLL